MYKVLIVDDDEIMREGTQKNIKWEEHDITIVATAANGMEALELICKTNPNIVLSDIRMPFMDGPQMVERINEIYPWIKVVLLTGFDDFEYAKKALKLKVCEYVLKYEDDEEILKAVLKARDELVMQKDINEKLEKSKPLMINKFLCDLMYGIGSDELAENSVVLSGITFRGKIFCVAVIGVDEWQMFYNSEETRNFDLLLFAIQNICNEIFEWYGLGIYSYNYQQRVNILFSFTEQDKDIQSHVLRVRLRLWN